MYKKQIYTFFVLLSVFCSVLPLSAGGASTIKKIKIRGFITNIISPTSFEIDDYKITRDEAIVLDFENQSSDIQFKKEDIRIGTEIEVQGLFNDETDELKATKITIDLDQFRKL